MKVINKDFLINEEIRDKELRVLGKDGEQLGILSRSDAQDLANEDNLDLVLISPTAKPPVARIMDYGKFLYEQTKKEKIAKKNQKVVTIKEIRLSASIDEHDIDIKANKAKGFLKDGDKVKVVVRFKGREADYSYIGKKILESFFNKVEEFAVLEKPAKHEGRNMTMFLAPKKS